MKTLLITTVLTTASFFASHAQNADNNSIPKPEIEGDFVFVPEFSDEFEGSGIDTTKWYTTNPTWLGRQPAFFSRENVVQKDGKLHLTMRKETPPAELAAKGYHTYSSAAVKSARTIKYGYFEIKSRAMNSKGSSAFWFYDQSPEVWTEIDVFELCGTGEREKTDYMTVHVFHTPLKGQHVSSGEQWNAPYRFADDYHVFGLEWTPFVIRWYVDGRAVRTVENTHWHQPLTMNFDSETMPDWFGLPADNELSSTFSIEYIRTWQYKTAAWKDEGKWINKMPEKTLVWADEFDYEGLPDKSKWNYEEGFVRNREPQYYTKERSENAHVTDGNLIIAALKEDFKGGKYTSASIHTKGKFEFRKGRVEVRAKLPSGHGVWPAIWTLGANIDKVDWPVCGEIDIMEYWGHNPNSIHANVHTGGYNHTKGKGRGGNIIFKEPWNDFHIFAVEWYDDRLDFYFDDALYYSCRRKGEGQDEWPFDAPQYLLINLALTGGQPGIDDTVFPAKYLIDYVRIYNLK
ncbi:MAG: family 16 glycosylhydrolase [Tannerella sp.]|jgi:beta-glucanase (GH16 family)|nr:family 16 glycosylhydrolase [Tannerella sp.]